MKENYKDKLLNKYSKYNLKEDDLENLEKTFSEFLMDEIENRDKIIDVLSDAVLKGKNMNDSDVVDILRKYRILNAS